MRALLALAAALTLIATGLVTAAPPAEAVTTTRIAGSDRFATSVEISRQTPATGDVVFLANGLKFPDALAAGPVVAAEGGHLLLTPPNQLPEVVAERIRELAPREVVVVGSAASVSDRVAELAHAAARAGGGGETLTRVAGPNRVETSLALLQRLRDGGAVQSVWVASGANFPDALVAASVAGRDRSAVVLAHHAPTAAGSAAWLDRVGPQVTGLRVNIAGDTPSVSAADEAGLLAYAAELERYAGSDRYQTARLINERFPTASTEPVMLLATGQNFPDALAGAVHAALRDVPMFLTPNACHATITPMLRDEADRRGIGTVVGLGSGATISDLALQLGPCPRTLQQQIGDRYGTFGMRAFYGSGDKVVDLGIGIPYGQLRVRMRANGFHAIDALDAGRELVDQPLNFVGTYGGTTVLAPGPDTPARYLQIETDGAWTIEVRDLTSAPVLTGSANGTGDTVYLYDGRARTFDATYDGRDLFGVLELSEDGWKMPINHQTGTPYSGSSSLRDGPSVISVLADARWTLRLR